jgi:hypothetical protein
MISTTKFRAKTMLASVLLLLAMSLSINAQTVRTVGTGGNYTTLKAAFDAINAGTITGVIELQIISDITETASATLYQSGYTGGGGTASYSSVKIYPTATGLTISGNLAAPLINLFNADYVTIDGRVNAQGETKDLTITNTSTSSTTGTSTIRFINDATNNTVKYCTIKGSSTAATSYSSVGGIIVFHTGTSTGNDYNTIEYNDITCASDANRPIYAISSFGSSGLNNNNTISNNNIYDFFKHGTTSYGVFLSTASSVWTITGNSFYETTSFIPTDNIAFYPIYVYNTSGNGFIISDNYIGGQEPECGGNPWTKTNAGNNQFYGIFCYVGSTTASNILGNTIQNISWSNSANASFYGMYVNGLVNIGSETGSNKIGESTGNNSIIFNGVNGGYFYGISIGSNTTTNCSYNTVGAITMSCANTAANRFYGIFKASGGTTTISFNTIGSETTTNSIHATSESTSNNQEVYGIYSAGSQNVTINNNTIANLNNGTTNTRTDANGIGFISGIYCSAGNNTITNNTIRDLTIANANTTALDKASVSGIALSSNNYCNVVKGNNIYNLTNTYPSFAGQITGIYFNGNTSENDCSENFIHSLSAVGASSDAASIIGIKAADGVSKFTNNIISLGGNTRSTIYGLFDAGIANQTTNVYFNTIYIDGALTSGSGSKSYCLYSNASDNLRDYRNNLLQNSRSTIDGSNLHYAISLTSNANLTCDYNDYYTNGTGGVLGELTGNKTTLAEWSTATGQDTNSKNIFPDFVEETGTSATDFVPQATGIDGIFVPGVYYDYNNLLRSLASRMGAFEQENTNPVVEIWSDGIYINSYNSLKAAFDAVNNGTATGNLEIKLTDNSLETATATLNASGTGSASYNSILIYPTKSVISIFGDLNMPLIDLNGADNVIIDGRQNATGTSRNLIISNLTQLSNYYPELIAKQVNILSGGCVWVLQIFRRLKGCCLYLSAS